MQLEITFVFLTEMCWTTSFKAKDIGIQLHISQTMQLFSPHLICQTSLWKRELTVFFAVFSKCTLYSYYAQFFLSLHELLLYQNLSWSPITVCFMKVEILSVRFNSKSPFPPSSVNSSTVLGSILLEEIIKACKLAG